MISSNQNEAEKYGKRIWSDNGFLSDEKADFNI